MTAQMSTASAVPTKLSDFTDIRREATRPPEFRDENFKEEFDADVLFFESFRRADGKTVFLGPPFFNLSDAMRGARLSTPDGQRSYTFKIREMDRQVQVIADIPADQNTVLLSFGQDKVEISIQPNEADLFANRRVMFTHSKNFPFEWTRDWVKFSVNIHGADAVLLYDNGSTNHTIEEQAEDLRRIEGLKIVHVVSWPFKFGPQGLDAKQFWDSDFCQLGALEHARWRYLSKAKSVQSSDIDELVLPLRGQSVFEAAEKDPFGVVRYSGRWVSNTTPNGHRTNAELVRHSDSQTVMKLQMRRKFGLIPYDAMGCVPKWTVAPQKCPEKAQWGIHRILGWLPAARVRKDFSFRHFREINNSWKYDRSTPITFDPDIHEQDDLLIDYMKRAVL
jgi:hypothetical protein